MKRPIFIVLVVLVALSALVYIHSKRSLVLLGSDLSAKEESLRKFQVEFQMSPDAAAIDRLAETNRSNSDQFKKLMSIVDVKSAAIPQDVSDKGIYFFESVYATTKLLERKAAAKKMIMPAVNFAVEIPKEEDIPYLLKQNEMIDQIMNIIIEAGMCEVEAVVPLPFDRKDKVLDFEKLSIQVVMSVDADTFIKVVSRINDSVPLYLIEELSLQSQKANRLKVNLCVSRIVTNLSASDSSQSKKDEAASLNKIYPLSMAFDAFTGRNPFFEIKKIAPEDPASAAAAGLLSPAEEDTIGPQFTYKGTIFMDNKFVGIIKDNWNNNVCFVKEGDTCSGYEVLSIDEKKAVLFKDEQEIEITKGDSNG